MIPHETRLFLDQWLTSGISADTKILSEKPLSGGSINEAWKLHTTSGSFFLKLNSAAHFPGMFVTEARGLNLLRNTHCIGIPKVLLTSETGESAFILQEFVSGAKPVKGFYTYFGKQLSALHSNSADKFGLDHDNYIGSLNQSNAFNTTWIDFLIKDRLQPLMIMAIENGLLTMADSRHFESLYTRLPEILPVEPPALLHGDLWSGNFMTGNDGLPCIFDPAVYYGHREIDIAMTKLFGGFPQEFYQAYNEDKPMEPGWDRRININQLYPLLVHVNLFGGGYTGQVRQIIGRF